MNIGRQCVQILLVDSWAFVLEPVEVNEFEDLKTNFILEHVFQVSVKRHDVKKLAEIGVIY